MGRIGTPDEWIAWLTGPEAAKRKRATLAMGGLYPDDDVAIEPFVAGLRAENRDVVFWCTVALERLGPRAAPAVPGLILAAGRHPAFGVRQSAVAALGAVAPCDAAAKSAVLHALCDESSFVRRQALQALIGFQPLSESDLSRIRSMANDPDEDVSNWSEIALRNIRLRNMTAS